MSEKNIRTDLLNLKTKPLNLTRLIQNSRRCKKKHIGDLFSIFTFLVTVAYNPVNNYSILQKYFTVKRTLELNSCNIWFCFWAIVLCTARLPLRNITSDGGGGNLTLHHVPVGVVSDGVDVRGHLVSFLPFVHINDLFWVNGQHLVGVHHHTEQARVCLGEKKQQGEWERVTKCYWRNICMCIYCGLT